MYQKNKNIQTLKGIILLSLLLLTGCGGGGGGETPTQNQDIKNGKLQLGVIANATVKLYELDKQNRKLIATETTTIGDTIDSIGNFNLHLDKLENDKFYLYQANGGEDYDKEDDGVVNLSPTKNQGVLNLLVKGSTVKNLQKISITALSEIVYQKLIPFLNSTNSEIETKINEFSKEIIKNDINNDGILNEKDILKYNPIYNRENLHLEYKNKINKITNDILNNKKFDISKPKFKSNNSEIQINENITLVQKIDIEDDSPITVTLSGEDSDKFIFNQDSNELKFINYPDFENPNDYDKNNIYNLTIIVTDSYYNKISQNIEITILDIDKENSLLLKDTNLSINENSDINSLIGTILIVSNGTKEINNFIIGGEDKEFFTINKKGEVFSNRVFDYEEKSSYSILAKATNNLNTSNEVIVNININNLADVKPTIEDSEITMLENSKIDTIIGKTDIKNSGDSNITHITLSGNGSEYFKINNNGDVIVLVSLDYEKRDIYNLFYIVSSESGDSLEANLVVNIEDINENF